MSEKTFKKTKERMKELGLTAQSVAKELEWTVKRTKAAMANDIETYSKIADRRTLLEYLKGKEQEKATKQVTKASVEASFNEALNGGGDNGGKEPPPPPNSGEAESDDNDGMLLFKMSTNVEKAAIKQLRRRFDELDFLYGKTMKKVYGGKKYPPDCKIRTMNLSLGLAKKFVNMDVLASGTKAVDRSLDMKRCVALKYAILKKAIPFVWAYVVFKGKPIAVIDKTDYSELPEELWQLFRENGQHTSWLFVMCPELVDPRMQVIVEEFVVRSMDEAVTLWGMFDNSRSARKDTDIYNAAAVLDANLGRLSGPNLKTLANQLSFSSHDKRVHEWLRAEHRKYHLFEMTKFAALWADLLDLCTNHDYGDAVSHLQPSKIARVAILRSLLDTWWADKGDCKKFWTAVVTSDNSILPAPDLRKLIDTLKVGGGASASNGGSHNSPENLTTQRHLHALCNTAWNQWRCGSKSKKVKFPEVLEPDEAMWKEKSEGSVWCPQHVQSPKKREDKDIRVGHTNIVVISVIPRAM